MVYYTIWIFVKLFVFFHNDFKKECVYFLTFFCYRALSLSLSGRFSPRLFTWHCECVSWFLPLLYWACDESFVCSVLKILLGTWEEIDIRSIWSICIYLFYHFVNKLTKNICLPFFLNSTWLYRMTKWLVKLILS